MIVLTDLVRVLLEVGEGRKKMRNNEEVEKDIQTFRKYFPTILATVGDPKVHKEAFSIGQCRSRIGAHGEGLGLVEVGR